eukprot:scaffold168_cov124-Cylindrotheca_fusiformis.AAC.13
MTGQEDETSVQYDDGCVESVLTERKVFDDKTSCHESREVGTVDESKKRSKSRKKKKSKKKKKKKLPAVEAPEFVRWERRNTLVSMVSAITLPVAILTEEDSLTEKNKSKIGKSKKEKKSRNIVPLNPPDSINCPPERKIERELSNISIPTQMSGGGEVNGGKGTTEASDWRLSEIDIPEGFDVSSDSLLGPL